MRLMVKIRVSVEVMVRPSSRCVGRHAFPCTEASVDGLIGLYTCTCTLSFLTRARKEIIDGIMNPNPNHHNSNLQCRMDAPLHWRSFIRHQQPCPNQDRVSVQDQDPEIEAISCIPTPAASASLARVFTTGKKIPEVEAPFQTGDGGRITLV